MDVPVWQVVYEELKDQGFEIISAAQDTGGDQAAYFFNDCKVTYTAIVDLNHTISTLYNMVNVPTGVWINEDGLIVRYDDGAYGNKHQIGNIKFGADSYLVALRDWVAKGADSPHVLDSSEVTQQIRGRSTEEALAEPYFKLGTHLYQEGDLDSARQWWKKAQELHPDSWNYHRQDWSFDPETAREKWAAKVKTLGGTPYYAPSAIVEMDQDRIIKSSS